MLNGMNGYSSAIYNRNDKPLPYSNPSINYEEGAFRNTNQNFRATNRGFSANKPQNKQVQKQFKDPDIWDSPPPIEKRPSVQRVNKTNSTRNHQVSSTDATEQQAS